MSAVHQSETAGSERVRHGLGTDGPWPAQVNGFPLPVPYVAAWSDELARPAVARPCEYADGRLAWFSQGELGVGEPVLGVMEQRRQREVVFRKRCQICRGAGRRALLIDVGEQKCSLEPGGPVYPCVREPWVCLPCASVALNLCRGIAKARVDGALRIYRVEQHVVLLALGGEAPGAEHHVSYAKIVPTRFRIRSELGRGATSIAT